MFEKRMGYVAAYKTLVDRLAEDKIFVLDKTVGWALPDTNDWIWIFVSSSLGKRRRLFALAHEMGHLYTWPRYGKIQRTTTKLRSEQRANEFAKRLISLLVRQDNGLDEYDYYKTRVKERRVYLRDIYGGQKLSTVGSVFK